MSIQSIGPNFAAATSSYSGADIPEYKFMISRTTVFIYTFVYCFLDIGFHTEYLQIFGILFCNPG